MDFARLQALGFDCVGGQIDRRGKNYGVLGADGTVSLTPAGVELVDELEAITDVPFKEIPAKPAAKKAAAKKAVVQAEPPQLPSDEDTDLNAELGAITGG